MMQSTPQITIPSAYREEEQEAACSGIELDMKELEYISSAGLRVLMIMEKERPENGRVTVCRVKPGVRSVLEDSEFDQLLDARDQEEG